MSAPTSQAIQAGWSFPSDPNTEQTECLICASPAQDVCHVAPCGHRLGCWDCVRNGIDQLKNCWLCRHPATALVQESTGKMMSVEVTRVFRIEDPADDMIWQNNLAPVVWPSRTLLPVEASIMRRMYIYHHHLFSAHVGANRTSGYREVTPLRFRNDLAMQGRARAFLRRELRVFAYLARNHGNRGLRFLPLHQGEAEGVGIDTTFNCLPGDEPDIVYEVEGNARYFIEMLKSIDLKGSTGAAEHAVESQLSSALSQMDDSQTVVRLFLHELRALLRSPYAFLKDWDANTEYGAPSRGAASVPRLYHGNATSARTRTGRSQRVGSQQHSFAQGEPTLSDIGLRDYVLATTSGRSTLLERIAWRRPSFSQSSTSSDEFDPPARRAPRRRAPLRGPLIPLFPRSLFAGSWSDYIGVESGLRFLRRVASGLEVLISTGSLPTGTRNESMTSGNASTARSTNGAGSSSRRRNEPENYTSRAGGSPSTAPPAPDPRGSWDFVGTITSSTNAQYDMWSLNPRQPDPGSTSNSTDDSSSTARSTHDGWSASDESGRAALSVAEAALSRAEETLNAAQAALDTAESALSDAEATLNPSESVYGGGPAPDSPAPEEPRASHMTQEELLAWQSPTSNRRRGFRGPHSHHRVRRIAMSNRLRIRRGMDG